MEKQAKSKRPTPPDPRVARIGKLLRRRRLEIDVSMEDVASALPRPKTDGWLSFVENGKLDPALSDVYWLADQLDLEVVVRPRREDPEAAVEQAVNNDPELTDDRREAVLQTYRALRGGPLAPARRRPSRRLRAADGTRTTGTGSPKLHALGRSGSSP